MKFFGIVTAKGFGLVHSSQATVTGDDEEVFLATLADMLRAKAKSGYTDFEVYITGPDGWGEDDESRE